MRYVSSLFIAFFLLFSLPDSKGQYYNTGQDPASARWLRIKTPKFDVIYPEEYGQKGIDFARTLDESYSKVAPLFSPGKARIPVIIHNYSTMSNGYVAWGPRRMELYPAPDQDAIPGDQHRLLALHEITHVSQMESLNTGFSRGMSYLFGEQFTGAISACLPFWYLEGNAVINETILSSSGRGRTPSFTKQVKAISTHYGNYSYDKILNGSFRDYVPDHYRYGYQMTAWAMARYNRDIWNKVLQFAGEQPFTLNPVNISLRKHTGLTKKRLYEEALDSLTTLWSEEILRNTEEYKILNPRKRGEYVNYHSPLSIGSDSIIALRNSLSETLRIVLVSAGGERTIHLPGSVYPYSLSYGNGKLLWVEGRPDTRWSNRDYLVIRLLDMNSGSVRSITNKSRYFSAAISPDGTKVAAIENTPGDKNSLTILYSESGSVIKSIPSPGNIYIQKPEWSGNGESVTVIFLTEEGEGIMEFSGPENRWRTLLEAGTADLQSSSLRNDSLFYVSSESGTDNIWLKLPGEEPVQLTSSQYGIRDLHLSGNNLFFGDYTAKGQSICVAVLTDLIPVKTSNTHSKPSFAIDGIQNPERQSGDFPGEYNPEPYRKWQNLFRFHSWMPFYADLHKIQSDPFSIRPGLTLMSQNDLSTLETTLAYEYTSGNRHVFHSLLTWYGWYPVISARLDYGDYPVVAGSGNVVVPTGLKFTGEIALPFSFSSGYFNQYLRISVNTGYSNDVYPLSDGKFDIGQTDITGRIIFSNSSRMASRDIYPRWAQTIDIQRVSAPFDRELFGSSVSVKTSFYFPGLFRSHGLKLRFETEKQNQSKFVLSNRVSFPRIFNSIRYPGGYDNIVSENLFVATADYVFPVAYPDFNISSLLYLKRVRSGFFFDQAWGKGNRYYTFNNQGLLVQSAVNDYTETFRSYGVVLLADLHVLRIPFPVSAGVQAAWRTAGESPVLRAVINMDLYGFSLGQKR